jgi:hypothetical protein
MFRSRWGFHPCDYAAFRKLKFLNQVHLRAVRMAKAWMRWKRKDPHNRIIRQRIRNERGQVIGYADPVPLPEPRICPVFSQRVFETRLVDKKGVYFKDGFLEEKIVTDDRWIPTDYTAARIPVANADDVRPLHQSVSELDAFYEEARRWIEGIDIG